MNTNYAELLNLFNANQCPSPDVIDGCLSVIENSTEKSNLNLLIGRCYHRDKRDSYAMYYIDKAIDEGSNNADAYYWKGFIKQSQLLNNEAIEAYTKSIDIDNANYLPFLKRGTLKFAFNQYDEALKDFYKANEINNKIGEVHYWIAHVFEKQNNLPAAEPYYRQASELGNYLSAFRLAMAFSIKTYKEEMNLASFYWTNQKDAECFASLDKALEMEILDDIEKGKLHLETGFKYYFIKQYGKALVHLDEAIALDPNNNKTWNSKGRLLYDQAINEKTSMDAAQECFERAITINSNIPDYYFNYALTYYSSNETIPKALELMNKAVELNPYYAEAVYNQGYLNHLLHNTELAKERIYLADELQSKNAKTFRQTNYGKNEAIDYFDNAINYSNKRQYQLAIDSYQLAIDAFEKLSKFKGDIHYRNVTNSIANLGFAQLSLKLPEAEISLLKAIERDPIHIDALNNLGNYYIQILKGKEAIELFDRIKKLDPNYELAYYNLGRVYLYVLKDYNKAIDEFNKAIDLSMNNVAWQKNVYFNRAKAYEALGLYQYAKEDYYYGFYDEEVSRMEKLLNG